jgi:hypothetical protein
MRENKEITLHPDRARVGCQLREQGFSMLAYVIETGLNLSGRGMTQAQYDASFAIAAKPTIKIYKTKGLYYYFRVVKPGYSTCIAIGRIRSDGKPYYKRFK